MRPKPICDYRNPCAFFFPPYTFVGHNRSVPHAGKHLNWVRRCTHMYCLFYGLIFFANESICWITHIFSLSHSGGPRLDRLHSTVLSRLDGASSLKRRFAIWHYSVQAVSSFNSPQSSRRYLSCRITSKEAFSMITLPWIWAKRLFLLLLSGILNRLTLRSNAPLESTRYAESNLI